MSQISESATSVDTQTSQATGSTTPQERLANSRKALVRFMTRNLPASRSIPLNADASSLGNSSVNNADFSASHFDPESARNNSEENAHRNDKNGALSLAQHALRAWWQHHPANLVVDIVRPVLSQYAEKKPVRLLAIAAGIGAVLVLLKPWRMVTPSGFLLGTLKSSGLSNMLLSLFSGINRK